MKTKIIIVILSLLMLAGCSTEKGSGNMTYKQVKTDEAIEIMQNGSGYIILDVRREDEFSAGHIPGAINVPNESIGDGDIPSLPDKDRLILVYCRSGRRSKEAAEKLARLGYTSIVEFGGILDWPGETEKSEVENA